MAATKKQMQYFKSEVERGVTAKLIEEGYKLDALIRRYGLSQNTIRKYVDVPRSYKKHGRRPDKVTVFPDTCSPAQLFALTKPWRTS